MAANRFTFQSDVPRFKSRLRKHLRQNVRRAALQWERGIKEVMTGDKSGKVYPVPGTSDTTYRASSGKKNEPPAVRTGNLRSSIDHRFVAELAAQIGSPVDYSLPLERGTKHMAKRPFIKPGFDKRRTAIKGQLNEAMRQQRGRRR